MCNTESKVQAAGLMSCSVIVRCFRPRMKAAYSIIYTECTTEFHITSYLPRILKPEHPQNNPNITAFGSNGSVYAQLFYDGVERFYCTVDSCSQDDNGSKTDCACQNLRCTCCTNTTFCGGGVSTPFFRCQPGWHFTDPFILAGNRPEGDNRWAQWGTDHILF